MDQKDYNKLVYPPGVKNITGDMATDDLAQRLQDCAQAFQNMSEDDDNSAYVPLALHLASENFLEHPSEEIRFLVAYCIAECFRVYAHDVPYKDSTQLKVIFEFFVDQLCGLEDPSNIYFNRFRYLLENFASVKSFNICMTSEENHKVLCLLFQVMFKVIKCLVVLFLIVLLSSWLFSFRAMISPAWFCVCIGSLIIHKSVKNKLKASKPLSIVDEQWELIDPHPDIHALLTAYDTKFFYGKLKAVEVKWSKRMTLRAGKCCYESREGFCSIRLSEPLLKLRPRRDLVETLLHEMIHAYLFVTLNNKYHDGHGPEFLRHMNRINKEAGTRITDLNTQREEAGDVMDFLLELEEEKRTDLK